MDALRLTAAWFGGRVSLIGVREGAAVLFLRDADRRVRWSLASGDLTDEPPNAGPHTPLDGVTGASRFELGAFGGTRRLAWSGGARPLRASTRVLFHGHRHALLLDRGAKITCVDAAATNGDQIEIDLSDLPLGLDPSDDGGAAITPGGEILVVGRGGDVVLFLRADDLLRVAAARPREVDVHVEHTYPFRRTLPAVEAQVLWPGPNMAVVVGERERVVIRNPPPGLERGQRVILRDALWPGTYEHLEIPGGPLLRLHDARPMERLRARVSRVRPKDPAAPVERARSAPADVIERLLAEVVATPEDDAPRLVLADALQEQGDPWGELIALQLHGGPETNERAESLRRRHQRRWLGPLAHFLEAVVCERGFPTSATLVKRPPDDASLLEAATTDLRLGTFESLERGAGPADVYRELVTSPRAVGLRRVDVSDDDTLAALASTGLRSITHLRDVRVSRPTVLKLLARPAFDAITHVETTVHAVPVARLLERVVADDAGFFARRPRHLIVRERYDRELAPMLIARWPALPVSSLTFADLTLRREPAGTVARFEARDSSYGKRYFPSVHRSPEDPFYAGALAQWVVDLIAIELHGARPDEEHLAALRRACGRKVVIEVDAPPVTGEASRWSVGVASPFRV